MVLKLSPAVIDFGLIAIGFGYGWHAWGMDAALSITAFVLFHRSAVIG